MTKNGKPKRTGKPRSAPDGGRRAKPATASAAKKPPAKAKARRVAPVEGEPISKAAAPTRPAPKLVLVKSEAAPSAGEPPAVLDQGLSEVRTLLCSAQASGEAWSGPLAESVSEASRGFAEINGKMLDLMRAQTDATLSLWRALLGAHSLGEAVGLQASEMRRQIEETASRMSDILATTNRLAADALKPMHTAFEERTRRAS